MKKLLEIQGTTQEEVDRLSNQIKSIEADMKINAVQQGKTRIYAPFSGIVGIKQVSLGAYVSPSTPIVTLQQIRPIKLEFDVPEKQLPLIKNGQTLTFTVQGSEELHEATVYARGTEVSPLTRTFKVRAISKKYGSKLNPGAIRQRWN